MVASKLRRLADRMTRDEIASLVRTNLGARADDPGSVIYSGLDTLKPNPFYIMGYNPGGCLAVDAPPLSGICKLKDANWSAYLHQCWHCKSNEKCTHIGASGESISPVRHQRTVCELIGLLGRSPTEIFATNAIFIRSRDVATLHDSKDLWKLCWPVHREFLDVIRPRWIICLGNANSGSVLRLLLDTCDQPMKVESCGCNFRDGKVVREVTFDLHQPEPLKCNILAIPHPSRFPLSSVILRDFIKKELVAGPSVH